MNTESDQLHGEIEVINNQIQEIIRKRDEQAKDEQTSIIR